MKALGAHSSSTNPMEVHEPPYSQVVNRKRPALRESKLDPKKRPPENPEPTITISNTFSILAKELEMEDNAVEDSQPGNSGTGKAKEKIVKAPPIVINDLSVGSAKIRLLYDNLKTITKQIMMKISEKALSEKSNSIFHIRDPWRKEREIRDQRITQDGQSKISNWS